MKQPQTGDAPPRGWLLLHFTVEHSAGRGDSLPVVLRAVVKASSGFFSTNVRRAGTPRSADGDARPPRPSSFSSAPPRPGRSPREALLVGAGGRRDVPVAAGRLPRALAHGATSGP